MRRNPNTRASVKIFLPADVHERLRICMTKTFSTAQETLAPVIEAKVIELEREINLKEQEAS